MKEWPKVAAVRQYMILFLGGLRREILISMVVLIHFFGRGRGIGFTKVI